MITLHEVLAEVWPYPPMWYLWTFLALAARLGSEARAKLAGDETAVDDEICVGEGKNDDLRRQPPDHPQAASFVVDRRIPLRDLITHAFRLDQTVEAYKLFASGTTSKAVFTWE